MVRTAIIGDIPHMQLIRAAVVENVLSDPSKISSSDYIEYLIHRGRGWVHELDETITGFSFIDVIDKNVWALFVHPEYEKRGVGRQLHDTMLNWYFEQSRDTLWLTTGKDTRAERFYTKAGWQADGPASSGEVRMIMHRDTWKMARPAISLSSVSGTYKSQSA